MNRISVYGSGTDLSAFSKTLKSQEIKHERSEEYYRGTGLTPKEVIIITVAINATAMTIRKAIESFAKHRKKKCSLKITDGHNTAEYDLENYSAEDVEKILPKATAIFVERKPTKRTQPKLEPPKK